MADTPTPDAWAIVELMGHVRLAGRLTEEEKFGTKMGRLDIPIESPCDSCCGSGQTAFMVGTPCCKCDGAKTLVTFVTQYFGGGSVYRITFVTEAVARQVARGSQPSPVSPWDFPKALPPGRRVDDDDDPPY